MLVVYVYISTRILRNLMSGYEISSYVDKDSIAGSLMFFLNIRYSYAHFSEKSTANLVQY